jgi:exodeoxyribonuclease VII large subunit
VTHAQRQSALAQRLQALDPKQVLSRGYAWLADANGQAIPTVARLAVGARLTAVLADGSADVAVTQVHPLPPLQGDLLGP